MPASSVNTVQEEAQRARLQAAREAVQQSSSKSSKSSDKWSYAALHDPSVARIKATVDRLHTRTAGRVGDMASAERDKEEQRAAASSLWAVPAASWHAARALLGRSQPWPKLLDYRALSLPNGWLDLVSRLRKNFSYFAINYTVLVLGMMVMLLAFRPTTLGMLSALAMLWVYVLQVRRDEMNVLGVRLGVRYQAVLLLLLTVVLVFLCTNAAAMLSSVASVGMACAGVHAALRTPEQDIQAEAEGDSTIYKGFTSFVESNLSNEALSKVSLDSLKTTFKLPDNPFTRRMERGVDGLWAGVEKGLNI